MEEKINDTLNASIDSWVEEYDNKNNDITELNKSMQKEQIDKGVVGGKKYILYDNNNNKKFFAKQLSSDNSRTQHLLEIASSSAFISCFSHMPYPIGIKNIDGKDFIVLRFEKKTADIDEETEEPLKPFINSFCTVHHRDLIINTLDHKEDWQSLSAKHKKYIIQLCVHQFFFSFFDRKYDNIIITDNGLHHIDTDLSGIGDWFMFASNGHQERYNKVKSFITFLHNISPNDMSLTNLFQTEINKIKKINYEKFVNRYIKSCIVLGIDKKEAYTYIKESIVKKMLDFFEETLTNYYNKDKDMQDNKYFKVLKQGFEETKNIIENNDILKKIMSNDEGEKWFTNKFQQKEKELKNQNTTEENKDENRKITSNQDNINTNNLPKNNNTDANDEKHNCSFVNKAEESRNNTDDNRNISGSINKTTSLSTNNSCNDCADKCLSIFCCCFKQ